MIAVAAYHYYLDNVILSLILSTIFRSALPQLYLVFLLINFAVRQTATTIVKITITMLAGRSGKAVSKHHGYEMDVGLGMVYKS